MFGFGYTGIIASMKKLPSGGGYGALTTAYATATGITDVTVLGALSTWEAYIVSKGLDSVYKQVCFLAAGTSGTAIINFMNPSTLSATSYGGLTYSSSGVTGNNVNGYLNSNFKPSTQLASQDSAHLSFYSNLTSSLGWGNINGGYDGNRFHYYDLNGTNYMAVNSSGLLSITSFGQKGTFLINRDNSANFKCSNGITSNTLTSTSTSLVAANHGIMQLLDGSNSVIGGYSDSRYSFWTAGSGMTSAQEGFHHIGITNLMTTLGINI